MFASTASLDSPAGPIQLPDLQVDGVVRSYSGSLPPGSCPVRSIRVKRHEGLMVKIQTASGRRLVVTPDHRMLVRVTPGGEAPDVYLVVRDGVGAYLGLAPRDLLSRLESSLQYDTLEDGASRIREKLWILSASTSLRQARYLQHRQSLRYGLPVHDLDPRLGRGQPDFRMVERLLREIETQGRVRKLMEAHQLPADRPHLLRTMASRGELERLSFYDVAYFSGPGGKHQLCSGTLEQARSSSGFETFSTTREIDQRVRELRREKPWDLSERMRLGSARLHHFVWPASLLRPGMELPMVDGDRLIPDMVTTCLMEEDPQDVFEVETDTQDPVLAGGLMVGPGAGLQ